MPPTASRSAARVREHLLTVLAPVVEDTGHDLEDVTVSAAGRRSLVRVTVDADGGVDLDAVAELSHAISAVLDEPRTSAVLAGSYVLEVSSPGVDRPLTEPRHWRRARGRLVSVPVDGASLHGRVLAADEAGVLLDVAGQQRHVAWGRLGTGHVQVEFNRPSAPGTDAHPQTEGQEG